MYTFYFQLEIYRYNYLTIQLIKYDDLVLSLAAVIILNHNPAILSLEKKDVARDVKIVNQPLKGVTFLNDIKAEISQF